MLATGLCFGAAWVTARVVSADVLGFTETFFPKIYLYYFSFCVSVWVSISAAAQGDRSHERP